MKDKRVPRGILVALVTLGCACSVAFLAAFGAGSTESQKRMEGVYATANRSFEVDPDPGDARKRLYLQLQGDVAKEMYRSMRGLADNGACGVMHLKLKQAGNITCMMKADAGEYECVFVLNAETGELEKGFAC